MPLGIVSDKDFDKEFDNSGRSTTIVRPPVIPSKDLEHRDEPSGELGPIVTSDTIIKRMGQGRQLGDVNVPHSLRRLIGDTATFEGRPDALQLANELGISNSSVAAYTHPESSINNLSDVNKADISEFLKSRKTKISKRAINKLGLAISLIDEDKLKELKATELSTVAKNMADVVGKMEPETKDEVTKPVQFVMYAPQVKQENHYQTVVAKDNY